MTDQIAALILIFAILGLAVLRTWREMKRREKESIEEQARSDFYDQMKDRHY